MVQPFRVLHVPGRTPYSRKLHGEGICIVNQTTIGSCTVPRDVTFAWIEQHDSLGFFDVLHIQSLELAAIPTIQCVLEKCARKRKGIVVSIHETEPMFPNEGSDFPARVRLACSFAKSAITLTACAARKIVDQFGIDRRMVRVVPHGLVLPPSHSLWHLEPERNSQCTIGMFGGFRPNRSFLTAAVNALRGMGSADLRVRLLSRGLSPIELVASSEAWQLASLAACDHRLEFDVRPFPSDDEIAEFVHALDILVLPYLYGTHSGQLELAMDLGVPVIIPDLGCFKAQWEVHSAFVSEPYWCDYQPEEPYSYGTPFLEALRNAHSSWMRETSKTFNRAAFHEIRKEEHTAIIEAHRTIYADAMNT